MLFIIKKYAYIFTENTVIINCIFRKNNYYKTLFAVYWININCYECGFERYIW